MTAGLFKDDAAIAELAGKLEHTDAGSSSHWREMHRALRFEDGRIAFAVGFGGFRVRPSGLRWMLERLLQRPYRRMAAAFPEFERLDCLADSITERQGRAYDLDVLRQSITLAMLYQEAPGAFSSSLPILVIGDGFGSMTSLIVGARPGACVILINLTQTLLADLISIRKALPNVGVALVEDAESLQAALADDAQVIALRADSHALIADVQLALAINIASMQEMRQDTVAAYFGVMRRGAANGVLFYTCNRVEKTLPDGEVSRFLDYPWSADDRIYFHGSCPWHEKFYTTRPPSYRPYDGDHYHRLALLAPIGEGQ